MRCFLFIKYLWDPTIHIQINYSLNSCLVITVAKYLKDYELGDGFPTSENAETFNTFLRVFSDVNCQVNKRKLASTRIGEQSYCIRTNCREDLPYRFHKIYACSKIVDACSLQLKCNDYEMCYSAIVAILWSLE